MCLEVRCMFAKCTENNFCLPPCAVVCQNYRNMNGLNVGLWVILPKWVKHYTMETHFGGIFKPSRANITSKMTSEVCVYVRVELTNVYQKKKPNLCRLQCKIKQIQVNESPIFGRMTDIKMLCSRLNLWSDIMNMLRFVKAPQKYSIM